MKPTPAGTGTQLFQDSPKEHGSSHYFDVKALSRCISHKSVAASRTNRLAIVVQLCLRSARCATFHDAGNGIFSPVICSWIFAPAVWRCLHGGDCTSDEFIETIGIHDGFSPPDKIWHVQLTHRREAKIIPKCVGRQRYARPI